MKAAAVLAFLSAAASVEANFDLSYNYNNEADPCFAFEKKACDNESFCVWTQHPRDTSLGTRQKNYGHHTAPAGLEGSCAFIHVTDRVNKSTKKRNQMESKFGLHKTWDTIECNEAFWMKDCKDINQNFEDTGSNKCEWSCEEGCIDASAEEATAAHPYAECEPIPPFGPLDCSDCNFYATSSQLNGSFEYWTVDSFDPMPLTEGSENGPYECQYIPAGQPVAQFDYDDYNNDGEGGYTFSQMGVDAELSPGACFTIDSATGEPVRGPAGRGICYRDNTDINSFCGLGKELGDATTLELMEHFGFQNGDGGDDDDDGK